MPDLVRAFRSLFVAACLFFSSLALAGVNVNTASQTQLESLPGIGPTKAAAIIEYRSANGPFTSLAQLDEVKGIGRSTLEKLSAHVVFDGESIAVPAHTASPSPSTDTEAAAESIPQAASTQGAVNINTANQSALQSLPGIGPSKAVAIIQDRETNGPFEHCGQLTRVRGVGPSTAANIASRCRTE